MEDPEIDAISRLIHQVDELLDNQMKSIQELLSADELKLICNRYEENKRELDEVGFSIFKIVSEFYYHEKFHSQIIATLLSPQEKHGEENKFLHRFLNYLKDNHEAKINVTHYRNTEVTGTKAIGEDKYIDIWIRDETSKHCIIIENKINNALDQFLQIPRYVEAVISEDYTIDAIIYLSLNGKKPNTDKGNWTEPKVKKETKEEIEKKLLEIAAFNNADKEKDLYHGWIIPCSNAANNIDALLVLRQYGKLLKSLNKTTMNEQIMGKFSETILRDDNFETAKSVRDMLEMLPEFTATRLANDFQQKAINIPFKVIKADSIICWFREYKWQESEMAIEIKVDLNKSLNRCKYIVDFCDATYYYGSGNTNRAIDILNILRQSDSQLLFNEIPDLERNNKVYYRREFEFPKQEKEMISFVDLFNKKLKEL